MKVAKLMLKNGQPVVISLKNKEDGWLSAVIKAPNHDFIERPLLEEESTGRLKHTSQEINIKTDRISTWTVEERDVKNNE